MFYGKILKRYQNKLLFAVYCNLLSTTNLMYWLNISGMLVHRQVRGKHGKGVSSRTAYICMRVFVSLVEFCFMHPRCFYFSNDIVKVKYPSNYETFTQC